MIIATNERTEPHDNVTITIHVKLSGYDVNQLLNNDELYVDYLIKKFNKATRNTFLNFLYKLIKDK